MAGTSDLLVATESATWQEASGQVVFIRPGMVVKADCPLIKGRQALFEPLIIEVAFADDLAPSQATVIACGERGDPTLEHGKETVQVSRWRTRPSRVLIG
jgi:hypothetical protein